MKILEAVSRDVNDLPPRVSGSTSRVGDTPRGLRPLGVSPPRSVDPSTLGGSLHAQGVNHLLHSPASSITSLLHVSFALRRECNLFTAPTHARSQRDFCLYAMSKDKHPSPRGMFVFTP